MGLMGSEQVESLVEAIKSKMKWMKKMNKGKKPYVKMDKSASVRVEIKSRKARRLIEQTLKAADRPGKIAILP